MRIWVDGCFDFFHHGHAGALCQSRALGDALVVGVHTDEEILKNKGPVVMHLDERVFAVAGCRWTTEVVSGAPYVTDMKVMDEYHCEKVAHGDDITTDADGNDTYGAVKRAGRFVEFKRTPNISTTDLIGRMLSKSNAHFSSLAHLRSDDAQWRFNMYAKGPDARSPHSGVFLYLPASENEANGKLETFVEPAFVEKGSKVLTKAVYCFGSFDLFHCGHIEFLRAVSNFAQASGCRVVVGLRSDEEISKAHGKGDPIMNVFERALCVLQCKFVDAVVLNCGSKESVSAALKEKGFEVTRFAEGAKSVNAPASLSDSRTLVVPPGKYGAMRKATIVERVLANKAAYEERQRKKGVKSENEQRLKKIELSQ